MKLAIFVSEELAKPRHRPCVLSIGEFLPPRAHPRGLSAKFRDSPRPPRNLVLKSAQANPTALPREFRVAPCQFPHAPAMCKVPVARNGANSIDRRKRKSAARAGRSSPRQFPRRAHPKDKRALSRQLEMSEPQHRTEPPAGWIATGADAARPRSCIAAKAPASSRSTAGDSLKRYSRRQRGTFC